MIMDINDVCGLIDNNLAELIHTVVIVLKFGVPLLLIIFGMWDLGKGVMASKEDEIKTGQHLFIKRLVTAAIVFFVITIVQLLISIVDDKNDINESQVWKCVQLILNGNRS